MATMSPEERRAWLLLRHADVTSTESPALFGLSPYLTAFELAQAKLGDEPVEWAGTERTDWGNLMEEVIAKRIGRVYGVTVAPMKDYLSIAGVFMGASFDWQVTGVADGVALDERLRVLYATHGPGIIECKNVDYFVFRKDWVMDENPEAPDHIEVQVQHQMHVSDRNWCVIAALVGGNKMEIIPRLRDVRVGQAIESKVREFWANLKAGKLPPIDLPRDVDIIKRLHAYAEPGKVYDGSDDAQLEEYCRRYCEAAEAAKAAENEKKSAQARILMHIGSHERALLRNYTISAGVVAPTEISFTREAYRLLRVTEKKKPRA